MSKKGYNVYEINGERAFNFGSLCYYLKTSKPILRDIFAKEGIEIFTWKGVEFVYYKEFLKLSKAYCKEFGL